MKPRSLAMSLLCVTALASALVVGPATAPSTAATSSEATATDVCIPSVPETDPLEPGPVDICMTVFKPASAATPVPMVLHSHGWGGTRTARRRRSRTCSTPASG